MVMLIIADDRDVVDTDNHRDNSDDEDDEDDDGSKGPSQSFPFRADDDINIHYPIIIIISDLQILLKIMLIIILIL